MPRATFRPPPSWPTPPAGWTPPPDWQPDPAWGPAPAGWAFWSYDDVAPADADPVADGSEPRQETGPHLGHRAQRRWRRAEAGLRAHLDIAEEVQAFFLVTTLRPLTDFVAVTTNRVLAGTTSDLSRSGAQLRSVDLHDITEVEIELAAMTGNPKLTLRLVDGSRVVLGHLLDSADLEAFRATIPAPEPRAPTPPTPQAAPPRFPSAAVAESPTAPPATQQDLMATPRSAVFGRGVADRATTDARISRLLDETVIGQSDADYIRSVLYG